MKLLPLVRGYEYTTKVFYLYLRKLQLKFSRFVFPDSQEISVLSFIGHQDGTEYNLTAINKISSFPKTA